MGGPRALRASNQRQSCTPEPALTVSPRAAAKGRTLKISMGETLSSRGGANQIAAACGIRRKRGTSNCGVCSMGRQYNKRELQGSDQHTVLYCRWEQVCSGLCSAGRAGVQQTKSRVQLAANLETKGAGLPSSFCESPLFIPDAATCIGDKGSQACKFAPSISHLLQSLL